ncbi:MAG TPA: response regulator [Anaerolineae bacterium]|nr:response regulator [Anaerolineae bacterium]
MTAKIILVDDDRNNARLIKMLLEMDGFDVTICPNIPQAIESTTNETNAFVIDCHLAGGANGLDLLRAIRNGDTNASTEVPVIVTSGDYRQNSQSMASGANKFMLKPYPPTDLSEELNKLLGQ